MKNLSLGAKSNWLFLAAEIPEPAIERALSSYGFLGYAAIWGLKIVITLTLLPVQSALERYIFKQESKRAERERAAIAASNPAPAPTPPSERPVRPGRPPRPTERAPEKAVADSAVAEKPVAEKAPEQAPISAAGAPTP